MQAWEEKHGLRIIQAWGMTETSPLGSVAHVRSTLTDRPEEELADVRASQGVASPLVELRIIDPDGEEQPWDGRSRGELLGVQRRGLAQRDPPSRGAAGR